MANADQSLRQIKAILKQIYGEKTNEEYNLTGSQILIGRSPRCQIKLSSPSISRHHCTLTRCNKGWKVKDSKSQNGTYVNGRQLKPDENFLLQYGDILFLGPPSEMPEAFSYEEIFQCEDEDMEDSDEDIVELPTKRAREQNTGFSSKKSPEKTLQRSKHATKERKQYNTDSASSKRHQKIKNKNRLHNPIEIDEIQEVSTISPVYENSVAASESVSRILGTDRSGQIYEITSTESDHAEYSESLLNAEKDNEINSLLPCSPKEHEELDTIELCHKDKSEVTGKDKELETKLALLSEQIKVLQASKFELLKDLENVCEKNKELDQKLADKEKKLEEELQRHELKAKNELKSELLEKFEEDLVCNICTELFIKPTVLDCSHTFCEYCIKEWKKKKNDCPICRCKIKNVTRVRTLEEFIDKTLATLTPEQRVKRDGLIAERFLAEQPRTPDPSGTPRRRRRGRSRRSRPVRSFTNSSGNVSVQILDEDGHEVHSSQRPEPDVVGVPMEGAGPFNVYSIPMFRFLFS